jgi:hypothetical protein
MQNKLTLKNRDKDINKGLRIKGRWLKHNCFFFPLTYILLWKKIKHTLKILL